MRYLATTFSPSMLERGRKAEVAELSEEEFASVVRGLLFEEEIIPAIGHENTARLLARRIHVERDLFSRIDLTLRAGDRLYCAVPQFRAQEAREFTGEEIEAAKFRFFIVIVD